MYVSRATQNIHTLYILMEIYNFKKLNLCYVYEFKLLKLSSNLSPKKVFEIFVQLNLNISQSRNFSFIYSKVFSISTLYFGYLRKLFNKVFIKY